MAIRAKLPVRGPAGVAAVLVWVGALVCPRPASPGEKQAAPETPSIALGRSVFFDARLSEPAGTSCASCHDPARAFSGDHGSGVGVPAGSRPGVLARRTSPSLLYLRYVPRLRFFSDDEDNHAIEYEPHGGYFWDGRSDSIAELVRQPLLNPREMNNRDAAQIAAKLRLAPYADAFRRAFPGALDTDDGAVGALGRALEAFLISPAMAPFSSKYDDSLRGTASLSPEEKRGLELFSDRHHAGCVSCHRIASTSRDPEDTMFTDYGYDAVGAPRNRRLRVRDDDRGLCERTDTSTPTDEAQYCASFRTPSLRNVGVRKAFMHNGAFTTLRDVVKFYATRASSPERWYTSGAPFDDTPEAYRGMVNITSVPYNRHRGDPPALSDDEIDAIVAFLETLTDRRR
jgi:cytochrome c peroxidase